MTFHIFLNIIKINTVNAPINAQGVCSIFESFRDLLPLISVNQGVLTRDLASPRAL